MPDPNESSVTVRPFARADRDQVTALANAHVAAVVPNASISVATLLGQLEREPGEFIEGPWVDARLTLVAEQRHRIVAAAHLQRFSTAAAPPALRDVGTIRWLLFWPDAPFWPDAAQGGRELLLTCLAVLDEWGTRIWTADGTLPAPGVYGVPEQWPHVLAAFTEAGFSSAGRRETVWLARTADLPRPHPAPVRGLTVARTLGTNGTRFSAVLDSVTVGYLELDTTLDAGSQRPRDDALADIGNLHVSPEHRRDGIATWLLAEGARWLDLGSVSRLLGYTATDDITQTAFLARAGFQVLTRTVRDLERRAPGR